MGLLDSHCNPLLSAIYDHISSPEPDGHRVVRVTTKQPSTGQLILKRGVIDQRGTMVIPANYDTLGTPDDDGNRLATVIDSSENVISGSVDKNGIWIPN